MQPEHRTKMGIRVWLYMFIIDQADWETGQVLDWKDQAAADELGMPLPTLRQQRQELESLRYIDCFQEGNHQRIVIKKWIDPRSYSGKVMNDDSQGNDEGEVEGNNKGNNKGTETSLPLHSTQISNIKDHISPEDKFFIGEFLRLSEIVGLDSAYQGLQLIKLKDQYSEGKLLEFAAWCKTREILTIQEALKSAKTALPGWKSSAERFEYTAPPKKKYVTIEDIGERVNG